MGGETEDGPLDGVGDSDTASCEVDRKPGDVPAESRSVAKDAESGDRLEDDKKPFSLSLIRGRGGVDEDIFHNFTCLEAVEFR